ncbi:MAG: tryptophan-rich sensory protein [Gemmatimonadaceae bacterium]
MTATRRTGSVRPWINLLSVLATITVNALANIIPFNGQNTGQISDQFKVYFVPAGYVFSIWGLIYIAWLAFCAYQLLPSHREEPRFRALGYWFALSGVFNSLWLVCWHYNQFILSLVVMVLLLLTLIACYIKLGVGHARAGAAERWCVDLPFGLYLGWISVATIANAGDVLYLVQWSGWGVAPQVWAVLMLGVATLLGAAMVWLHRDAAFALVLAWAFVGIAKMHTSAKAMPDAGIVVQAAWAAAGVALVLAVVAVRMRRQLARAAV